MGRWGGAAGRSPVGTHDPSQVTGGFLVKRQLLRQRVSTPQCTRWLPEDPDGTLAHLSLPKNLVLPLLLSSDVEGSLADEARAGFSEVSEAVKAAM